MCVQHEMDHLQGKVFVEYLSPLKRNRIKTKMLKKSRATSEAPRADRRSWATRPSRRLELHVIVAFAGTPEFARVALRELEPRAIASHSY